MKGLLRKVKQDWSRCSSYPQQILPTTSTDYESYWQQKRPDGITGLTPFQRDRVHFIAARIKRQSTVLDIGAGDCAILQALKEQLAILPTAVDVSAFSEACAKSLEIPFISANFENTAVFKTFPEADYILALEVLEHLSNPELIIQALLQKCRKGLFFSIPNTGYYVYRLRLLFGKAPNQWLLHPGEHLRFWTMTDLSWWIQALQLPIQHYKITAYQGLPLLKSIAPSLFGEGLICYLEKS